ncbi:NAD(P)/FAD-dependent oxidoreductase [Micromonospora sp. WMMA1363]|uniref:NAD(P)/FAD-dependent oxidoreductase n=1 Tax=Micromonospora sp. WMMA1363 TaxID=3053985 RepID=UPI00259CF203|nr:NAD(P)/FAD-dependent oxidoreductase [Micromonospora sp. WMMA1363]MDM4721465.1 NAD(P)/FAD-dependent oxidoreductase [Micromonospora sp. WMMA1363]
MPLYDAIVIGARCAGASTGMLLARQGHRVLVVDRSDFPSDVISTHFLWPHGMSYLNRWGLLDQVTAITPTHTEVTMVNDGISLTGSVPSELLGAYFRDWHGDDSGVVRSYASVRRRVLDQLLVEAASKAGAEVRTNFTVRELITEAGRVVGVRGRTSDGTMVEERARIVVGADGRNSFVARALDLPRYDERPRCTFAYWSYYSGFDLGPAQLHRRGRLACAVVPTNFDQNMVLVWGPSEWSREFRRDVPGNLQRTLDFVSPELGEVVRTRGVRAERVYGTLDQSAFLRPLSGPGWVLVGDAESFKDQCTATGMTHAFRDAELVSSAVGRWLSGNMSLDEAMTTYESRRRSQNAAAYYDYVCTLAEMRPYRHDELQLFVALRGNQLETDRFIATHADIAPVSEFFQASNLLLLNDAATETSVGYPVFDDFNATVRTYQQNLFA